MRRPSTIAPRRASALWNHRSTRCGVPLGFPVRASDRVARDRLNPFRLNRRPRRGEGDRFQRLQRRLPIRYRPPIADPGTTSNRAPRHPDIRLVSADVAAGVRLDDRVRQQTNSTA